MRDKIIWLMRGRDLTKEAKEILSLITEEIEKVGELSDHELDVIYRNMPFGSDVHERERVICQQQTDKILSLLK